MTEEQNGDHQWFLTPQARDVIGRTESDLREMDIAEGDRGGIIGGIMVAQAIAAASMQKQSFKMPPDLKMGPGGIMS